MSRNKYSAAFKSKVILEILRGERENSMLSVLNTISAPEWSANGGRSSLKMLLEYLKQILGLKRIRERREP